MQVLTGTLPFGKRSGWEVVFKVVEGTRPTKPEKASQLGLSGKVWTLLEDCWQTDRELRPSVRGVLSRVKSAASSCGTLPSVGYVAHQKEEPDSDIHDYGMLHPSSSRDVELTVS